MLTLVLRRVRAQGRLLLAVLAVVTLGTTLLGVGALLLGTTQDRAFAAGVRQAQPRDVDVTAFLVDVKGPETADLRDDARAVVRQALNQLHPTLTSNAVSRMRRFGDSHRLGYLESTDSLNARSKLTSGRWATGAGEAVVPQTTADGLKLRLGERITLGEELGLKPAERPVTVRVVGTFRPTSREDWEGDPLGGSGYNATYSDGSSVPTPAYGPFVVDDATFLATGSTVDALQVTGHPSLGHATNSSMTATVDRLRSADGLLTARVGTRVEISRLASDLPVTLDHVHAQQAATRSMVLVVLLMGTTLALTALLLAGRLLDSVRQTERALLADLGLGRRQLVVATLLETLLAAAAATVLAVPAAVLAHSAVTHLPAMASAGLSQGPTVTVGLVLTEVAGAILLALALAVPVLGPTTSRRRVAVARSGVDLLLVAVAVAAWWQVHSQPSTSTSGDTTRTLAPLICIAAATVVGVRGASLLVGLFARVTARSSALVLPLASTQAARRPYAGIALVLLAMATASATFGIALQATWQRSQDDQASVRVGTDLALAMSSPATDREAASIAKVTGGSAASAVTDRALALGRYVGDTGAPPRLVAVDALRAGQLLRGRLDDHRTWSGIGNLLAPHRPVTGLRLSSGGVSVEGTAPESANATVAVTLVVQDASGFRRTATADAVPLDGRSHRLHGLGDVAGTRLVAARMTLSSPGSRAVGVGTLSVALSVPGSGGRTPDWFVRAPGGRDNNPIQGSAVSVVPLGGGTVIRTRAQVDLQFLSFEDGDLLATAFATPTVLPVAVSQRLADQVGVKVGGKLSGTVGETVVPLRVVTVIPAVPSEPGNPAVLGDSDTLSRMLVGADDLEPAVDAWWVADPKPGSAPALRRLDLGEVTSRGEVATQLRQGPLRASIPAALTLLVVAAALLLLAGAALVIGSDRPARSAEVARLRALGLTRRAATRLVLTEHGILLSVLVLTGVVVGGVASLALGPSLIRSDVGVAPVPEAVLEWPWVRGAAVIAGVLLGCLAIAAVITVFAVRRSGAAQLREVD